MAMNTRQRQTKFRARMKRAGYVAINIWVPADKKAEILDFIRKQWLTNTDYDSVLHHRQLDVEDMI